MCVKNAQPCVLSRTRRALLYATIVCVAVFGVSTIGAVHSAGYPSDLDWRGVAFGNGVFVAVASSGADNRVMTSVDGETWTLRQPAANSDWHSVTFHNNVFVAVGTNAVMTSQDGISWTLQSAPNGNWDSVVGCNGTYVATATAGSPYVMYSTDSGSNWTVATPAFGWDHQQLACNPNGTRFVSSSHYGRVWSSADGISWIAGSGPIVHLHAKAFAVLNGVNTFVMLEYDDYDRNGSLSATSTNGTAFAAGVYNSNLINGWEFMTFADNKFVAVAHSGNNTRAAYSTDGVNWSLGNGIPANAWEAVAYGNGTFVTVASSGTENRVAISADGITWTAVSLDSTLTSVPNQSPPQEDSQQTPSTVVEIATTTEIPANNDSAVISANRKTSGGAIADSRAESLPRAGVNIDTLWISLLVGVFGIAILFLRNRLMFQRNRYFRNR